MGCCWSELTDFFVFFVIKLSKTLAGLQQCHPEALGYRAERNDRGDDEGRERGSRSQEVRIAKERS